MKRILLATVLLGVGACTNTYLLDNAKAPPYNISHAAGTINPAVSQTNIKQTICVPGWTATVRPPVSYTNKLKAQQLAAAGINAPLSDYEEDHVIPLEIGGNPTDPNNLTPQPWAGPKGAHVKDVLENKLHRLVCAGTMPLDTARTAIKEDWVTAYSLYVGPIQ